MILEKMRKKHKDTQAKGYEEEFRVNPFFFTFTDMLQYEIVLI